MPGVGAGVGHVHFMFFVLISFVFCSQRKPSFRWNMGLKVCAASVCQSSYPPPGWECSPGWESGEVLTRATASGKGKYGES